MPIDSRRVPLTIVPPLPQILKLTLEEPSPASGSLPNVTYHGGALIASVDIYALYWGSEWTSGAKLQDIRISIDTFLGSFVKGSIIAQLAEYSTDKYKIDRGTLKTSRTMDDRVPSVLTDDQVRNQLKAWISAYSFVVNDNSLFLIFLPPGVQVRAFGGSSPSGFVGYHANISNIFYGVVTYPSSSPRPDDIQRITITVSHEVCEAITNPSSSGWWDPVRGEIGDICDGKIKLDENGYWVQKLWSQTKQRCL